MKNSLKCQAAKETYQGLDGREAEQSNGMPHNHDPPNIRPVLPNVRKKIDQLLRDNRKIKPAEIEQQLYNSTDDPEVLAGIPNRLTISQMKYYRMHKWFPSADAVQSIILKHGKEFVRKIKLHPYVTIVFAADTALNILNIYGSTLYIDGTFKVCEGDLSLTTIMVKVDNIGISICWLLSDNKTQESYESFFKYIIKLTKGNLKPQYVIGDFEEALVKACSKVCITIIFLINNRLFHKLVIMLMLSIGFNVIFAGYKMKEGRILLMILFLI